MRRLLQFRTELTTLWRAFFAPETPVHLKALMLLIPAYLLSPIDLIPDFIPILGYLDDLILVPVGVWLVLSLIPPEVLAEHRTAAEAAADRPMSRVGATFIVGVWIAVAVIGGLALIHALR